MAAPVIQFKRGAFANLPGLQVGEPALTTDTYDFYVGIDSTTNNNKFFGSHRYWTKETASTGSAVNLVENTGGTDYISLKSPDTLAGITTYTFPATATNGYFLKTNANGVLSWESITSSATFENATLTGVTTITNAVVQGGSINNTTVGLTTAAAGQFTTLGANSLNVSGIATVGSVSIGATEVISSTFQLKNIASLDATTTATIEAAVANAPNTFTDLNITGITTLSSTTITDLSVSGVTTFTNTVTGTISTATRATQVDTTGTSTDADYYLTFVDTAAGQTGETLRVGAGISFNPSSNKLSVVGDLKVGGIASVTQLSLSGTNLIDFADSGTGSPTFTTRSAGTKVVLYPSVGGSTVDYALGISAATLWNAVPENGSSFSFKWFGGETEVASLSGIGSLSVAGDIQVGGNDILASDGVVALTLSASTGNVAVAGDLKVGGNDIQASDGTTAITLSAVTGNVGISSNLTVSGNLYVNGSTTQVNTTAITVEDRTLELGRVDGNVPASQTTWDLGVLFNYYDTAARKSAVIWEQGDTRFKFASVLASDTDGTDINTPQLTVTTFAPIEIGALWVNDCAGSSQVINCAAGVRTLENITIDAGTF